jgi:response regulator RpfG family c-di-GMP phosphodiesterase
MEQRFSALPPTSDTKAPSILARRFRKPPCGSELGDGDPSLILIVSDIKMPSMSSLEMLPKVQARTAERSGDHETAYGDEDTKRHPMAQGAIGC